MYERFKKAVETAGTTDLIVLTRILNEVVVECLQHNVVPFTDPAVMLLSRQIAFAGNGDNPDISYYKRCYEQCKAKNADPFSELKFEQFGPAS